MAPKRCYLNVMVTVILTVTMMTGRRPVHPSVYQDVCVSQGMPEIAERSVSLDRNVLHLNQIKHRRLLNNVNKQCQGSPPLGRKTWLSFALSALNHSIIHVFVVSFCVVL